jgi:hypothetical protein
VDLQDVVLDRNPGPGPPLPSGSGRAAWAILALVLVAGAAALYWYGNRPNPSPAETKPPATDAQVPAPPPRTPLGGETAGVDLPPLDQSDALVRELVHRLSSHPSVSAWLATTGLIRNFVVVVENIATGATPARQLRVLAPRGPFRVIENDRAIVIDPAGYRRYDAIAAAVSGIDPAGAARVYSTLKPRIEEAYRELGRDASFDVTLESAIVSLLQAPVVESEAALVSRGALFRFANPRLEGLTAAQKQFVRMGPEHVRTVQLALQRIAAALGIPAERLPAVR